jgi:hypothetical protein
MANIIKALSTHASKLERWLGKESCADLSRNVRDWYGPPIAVANVPGTVYARGGGDFVGPILGGYYGSLADLAFERMERWRKSNFGNMDAGFASLSAIIAAATQNNGSRFFTYNKGTLAVATNAAGTLFFTGPSPAAGSIASAAPGGTTQSSSTTGCMPFTNPSSGTQHLVSAFAGAGATNSVMLYDRLFSVAKTMNTTASEAVTGAPTRYQSTTAANDDYIGGNFLFPEVVTGLPGTAHNHTVITYTDETATSSTLPSIAGVASAVAGRLDLATFNWYMPLAAGDVGIQKLTQLQLSANVASGTLAYTIGHPIAIFPSASGNQLMPFDGINSAFNLVRIFDSACLSLLILPVGGSGATQYYGSFQTVTG